MKRVQRLRRKGYRTPENTKYVGRPTKWGNPFALTVYGLDESLRLYEQYIDEKIANNELDLRELEGKNLSCWCSLNKECHADILLRKLEEVTRL